MTQDTLEWTLTKDLTVKVLRFTEQNEPWLTQYVMGIMSPDIDHTYIYLPDMNDYLYSALLSFYRVAKQGTTSKLTLFSMGAAQDCYGYDCYAIEYKDEYLPKDLFTEADKPSKDSIEWRVTLTGTEEGIRVELDYNHAEAIEGVDIHAMEVMAKIIEYLSNPDNISAGNAIRNLTDLAPEEG